MSVEILKTVKFRLQGSDKVDIVPIEGPQERRFYNGGRRRAGMAKVIEQDVVSRFVNEKGGKYLTFALGDEEYGIGILKVKEIIGMMPITLVPQTPLFVKGVVNLRGKVIPVVDLRTKFGMSSIAYSERTCIIVVEINAETGSVMMGIVVDSVCEVIQIKNEDIEETPRFTTMFNTEYISGMAKMGGRVKILLDIDKVLSEQEVTLMEEAV